MPPALPQRAILMVTQKSSGLAAVMSFFWSGLGQIYTGQIGKGILMMILYPILIWTGLGTIIAGGLVAAGSANANDAAAGGGFALFGLLSLIASFAVWVYGIVNAYRTAERLNRHQIANL
jgi:TM2 domain-containing membrane protein YozV